MRRLFSFIVPIVLIISGCSVTSNMTGRNVSGSSVPKGISLDTIKAGRFDTGRMWTFEYPPNEYFKEVYGFIPTQGWLDSLRLGALRFSTYCSASFVSEDGLIMTNDHCARESATSVSDSVESLSDSGFYAATFEEERKVPDLFVDQLVLLRDITDEVSKGTGSVSDYKLRTAMEQEVIQSITDREEKTTGLMISVVPLYNGGRYSLYGYKRYEDVRLVFTPESQLGYFGGDYDNFTYPRYNLDCSFFRVYDKDGLPVNSKNYFHWDTLGAEDGEPVFVVGNPGSTSRLNTVAQLEYSRDFLYPQTLRFYQNMISVYNNLIEQFPDKKDEYTDELLKYTNSEKVVTGTLQGLNDPLLMQRKKDFEKNFRAEVDKVPELKDKYGDLWDKIASIRNRMGVIESHSARGNNDPATTPEYIFIAQEILNIADELKLPEDERTETYTGTKLDSLISALFPAEFDKEQNRDLLIQYIKSLYEVPGKDDPLVYKFTKGKSPEAAADYIISNSGITNEQKVKELISKGSDEIYSSDDPFIQFEIAAGNREYELQAETNSLSADEEKYNKLLGNALYDVYGTKIPPDASFTLRLADGVIKGFPYNGTVAPPFTTFYGMYDRYYSFDKQMPWALPGKWENPPKDFKINTPFNFVSTNDIIGGNSGSPVLNKKGKVVGLAFDGNMESLPGDFIYSTETNRMLGVDVRGMLEALSKIYKATRLVNELKRGTSK